MGLDARRVLDRGPIGGTLEKPRRWHAKGICTERRPGLLVRLMDHDHARTGARAKVSLRRRGIGPVHEVALGLDAGPRGNAGVEHLEPGGLDVLDVLVGTALDRVAFQDLNELCARILRGVEALAGNGVEKSSLRIQAAHVERHGRTEIAHEPVVAVRIRLPDLQPVATDFRRAIAL